MSKLKKAAIITAVFAILSGAALLALRILFFEPKVPSRKDDFLPLITEYTQVAEYYSSDFEKYDAERLIYSVPDGNEAHCFNSEYVHELPISEPTLTSVKKIKAAYYLDKHHLEDIIVDGNYVLFGNIAGRAVYIYSKDGTKPESADCLNSGRALVYKMADNWYFTTVPEKWF